MSAILHAIATRRPDSGKFVREANTTRIGDSMSFVKSLVGRLIALSLSPLRARQDLLHYVRGTALLDPVEHLYRAARYINSRNHVTQGALVIDVGAADGGTALWLQRHLRGVRVVCFEPHPEMARSLKSRLHCRSAEVRELALGEGVGPATLYATRDPLGSSLLRGQQVPAALGQEGGLAEIGEIQVRQSTLDVECADLGPILLLKLDTQGSELQILGAARRTLQKTAFVLTELSNHRHYQGSCAYHETDTLLRSRGFRLADLTVTYHSYEHGALEFDALYENSLLSMPAQDGKSR
jgi:FkbM family methyltransferase